MQAFHNNETIKQKYLKRVETHRIYDELVQGITWRDGKGCAVGCTLETYDHKAYETELGIPEWLARVEDSIFEGLIAEEAQKWPERFLAAINPGADLNKVKHPFIIYILRSNLKKFDNKKYPDIVKVTNDLIALHEQDEPDDSPKWSAAWNTMSSAVNSVAWSAADSAAWSAADSAAWSAANSAAWSVANNVAWSVASSAARSAANSAARSAANNVAWSAASSAANSVAWSAAIDAAIDAVSNAADRVAWNAAYKSFADKLIELLEACK